MKNTIWNLKKIEDAIQLFVEQNDRLPVARELNHINGLPTRRTIEIETGMTWGNYTKLHYPDLVELNKQRHIQKVLSIRQEKSDWTKESLIAAMEMFTKQNNRLPSSFEFTKENNLPSYTTFRKISTQNMIEQLEYKFGKFIIRPEEGKQIHTEETTTHLQNTEENKKFQYEDLQSSIKIFYEVHKHYQGYSGDFADWVRAVYEINEDFEERIIDVSENVCNSLKAVEETYGYDIAKEIYDEKMAILPNEITEVGKYLSFGGDREKVNELLNGGFFMDNKTHDEMQRFIESHEPSAPVMSM